MKAIMLFLLLTTPSGLVAQTNITVDTLGPEGIKDYQIINNPDGTTTIYDYQTGLDSTIIITQPKGKSDE